MKEVALLHPSHVVGRFLCLVRKSFCPFVSDWVVSPGACLVFLWKKGKVHLAEPIVIQGFHRGSLLSRKNSWVFVCVSIFDIFLKLYMDVKGHIMCLYHWCDSTSLCICRWCCSLQGKGWCLSLAITCIPSHVWSIYTPVTGVRSMEMPVDRRQPLSLSGGS